MVELSQSQDDEVGDGTTGVVGIQIFIIHCCLRFGFGIEQVLETFGWLSVSFKIVYIAVNVNIK